MMQSSLIQQLMKLPKLTIKDFYNKENRNKISKTAISSPLYFEANSLKGSCIDVREPFYIDRYLKDKHVLKDGFCYACQYGKVHRINLKHKIRQFQNKNIKIKKGVHLRHKTQNIEKFRFFDREYFKNSEVGSVTINFLLNFVKDKINEVSQNAQEKFQHGTGFHLKSDKVIGACLEYFMTDQSSRGISATKPQLKKLSDDNVNKKSLMNEQEKKKLYENKKYKSDFESVFKQIHEANMNNLVLEQKFLKFHKNHNENYETTIKNLLQFQKENFLSRNSLGKENSIRFSKQKIEGRKKKKGKLKSSQNSSSDYLSKANSIYTQLMNDLSEHGENSLGEQIQDRLNDFSTSGYRQFQQIFNVFENKMMIHLKEKNRKQAKMINKLETASIWMKNCVNQDDVFYLQKHQRIERSLSNFKRESRNTQKSKTSLAHINSSSKIQSIVSIDTNNSKRTISEQKISKKSEISSSNGTKKRQMMGKSKRSQEREEKGNEQQRDENEKDRNESNGQIQIRVLTQNKMVNDQLLVPQKKFEKVKLERKVSSLNKTNMSKYTKSQQISWEEIEVDSLQGEKREVEQTGQIRHIGGLGQGGRQQNSRVLGQQRNRILRQRQVLTNKTLQKIQEIEYVQQTIYERHKKILKLKASELLRRNEQVIEECVVLLKELDLGGYVIRDDDCVFNQRKKIRMLKQIIYKNDESYNYEKNVVDKIVEYLLVYQQNCEILIETNLTGRESVGKGEDDDMGVLVGRKDYYDDLYFYGLNGEYCYGGAEDNDIFFAEKDKESIVLKHERGKKIVHRMDLDRIFDIMKQPILIKPDVKNRREISDSLMQVPLGTKVQFEFVRKRLRERNGGEGEQINNSNNKSSNNRHNNSNNSNNSNMNNNNKSNEIDKLMGHFRCVLKQQKENKKQMRRLRRSCQIMEFDKMGI